MLLDNIKKTYNNNLIYDGDCPFCTKFVEFMEIKKAMPELKLLNAREENSLVQDLYQAGYNINTGMVLIYQEQLYYKEECVHKLTKIIKKNNFFNKLINIFFNNIFIAKICYPILRAGRRLWLLIRRIPLINIKNTDHEK
ncbi:MAG: DUF393 domain-containing protein [Gammaproteobacteria bacterium]|nr:DUF393 domain-containing protein [Gammaproteobacteria bacterium]